MLRARLAQLEALTAIVRERRPQSRFKIDERHHHPRSKHAAAAHHEVGGAESRPRSEVERGIRGADEPKMAPHLAP